MKNIKKKKNCILENRFLSEAKEIQTNKKTDTREVCKEQDMQTSTKIDTSEEKKKKLSVENVEERTKYYVEVLRKKKKKKI